MRKGIPCLGAINIGKPQTEKSEVIIAIGAPTSCSNVPTFSNIELCIYCGNENKNNITHCRKCNSQYNVCNFCYTKVTSDDLCYECHNKIEECFKCKTIKEALYVSICDSCSKKILLCYDCSENFACECNKELCVVCKTEESEFIFECDSCNYTLNELCYRCYGDKECPNCKEKEEEEDKITFENIRLTKVDGDLILLEIFHINNMNNPIARHEIKYNGQMRKIS